jgi:hypothetical protein
MNNSGAQDDLKHFFVCCVFENINGKGSAA